MTREIELSDGCLRRATSLPDLLAAGFDAFEVIRRLARQSQGKAPDLLAAFMSAATVAADGRDAIASAPALLSAGSPARPGGRPGREPGPQAAADSIARLAAVLADRLDHAASLATTPRDWRACEDGAQAARQIYQLMAPAGDSDDSHAR
jgi:hypothetical protein